MTENIDKITVLKNQLKAVELFESGQVIEDLAETYHTTTGRLYLWLANKKDIESELFKLENPQSFDECETVEKPEVKKTSKKCKTRKMTKTENKAKLKEEALEMRSRGMKNVEIAKHFGVSHVTIWHWLKGTDFIKPLSNKSSLASIGNLQDTCKNPVKRKHNDEEICYRNKKVRFDNTAKTVKHFQLDKESCASVQSSNVSSTLEEEDTLGNFEEEYRKICLEEYKNVKQIYMSYFQFFENLIKLSEQYSDEDPSFNELLEPYTKMLDSEYFKQVSDRYLYLGRKLSLDKIENSIK